MNYRYNENDPYKFWGEKVNELWNSKRFPGSETIRFTYSNHIPNIDYPWDVDISNSGSRDKSQEYKIAHKQHQQNMIRHTVNFSKEKHGQMKMVSELESCSLHPESSFRTYEVPMRAFFGGKNVNKTLQWNSKLVSGL
jgi:hypothetical protein